MHEHDSLAINLKSMLSTLRSIDVLVLIAGSNWSPVGKRFAARFELSIRIGVSLIKRSSSYRFVVEPPNLSKGFAVQATMILYITDGAVCKTMQVRDHGQ